jgi:predicted transposase YdaD
LTGYSPSELMFGEKKPSIFDKMLPKLKQDTSNIEDLDTKLKRIKRKAVERGRRKKGNTT